MNRIILLIIGISINMSLVAQVNYTANDFINPYDGHFRPGSNIGLYESWSEIELANLMAGNPALDIDGVGVRAVRPALHESFVEEYGYETLLPTYQFYDSLDLKDNTVIVGFPSEEHRDPSFYCPTQQSTLFANLYEDIWDGGANGTPVNENNYYALYIYKLVSLYKDHVKFWEIWNEPGFDYTFASGWLLPGQDGNWWDNNPDPCDYKLRAPIFHYIRILRISYEVIKSVDPQAYVTVSGVGYPSFLDAILRNTDNPNGGTVTGEYPNKGGAYIDVMGFHSYPHFDSSVRYWSDSLGMFIYERHSDKAADGIMKQRLTFEEVLEDHGYDGILYPKKEWIVTECNLPRAAFNDESMGSDEVQRNFIIKAYVESARNGFLQIDIYQLAEIEEYDEAGFEFDLMGLYKKLDYADGYFQRPNEEGIAYQTTTAIIFGSDFDEARTNEMQLPNGVRGAAFKDEDGNYTYVLWAETTIDLSEVANANYSFPSSMGVSALTKRAWDYGQTNEENIIGANNIALTATPIFLTEALFSVDIMDGCSPLTAQFTSQIPNVSSWLWTFEGGMPAASALENPSVQYNTSGDYEVRLELFDANGNVIATQSSTTYIETNPDADYTYSASGPIIVFSNQSANNGDNFLWDFGDGTMSTEPSPLHVFFDSGDYDVQLTTTNECGSSTTTQTITIEAPGPSPVGFTANDQVPAFGGTFRPGANTRYYPPWTEKELANIAAGNIQENVTGIGVRSMRPLIPENFVNQFGYDASMETFDHYANLDIRDNTAVLGFASQENRDPNLYCSSSQSFLFENMYLDIWDDGSDGTPYNDDNYYAAYVYNVVNTYKDHVRFWEIWSSDGSDVDGELAWLPPGEQGNWWENNPEPCDLRLKAPIFHYIRTLRISYEIIKYIDEDAFVTISGLTYPSFLDAVCRNTDNPQDGTAISSYPLKGGAYFDAVAYNAYPHSDGSTRYYDVGIGGFVYERHSDAAAQGLITAKEDYEAVLENYGYDGTTYPEKEWTISACNIPRVPFQDFLGGDDLQRNFIIKAYVKSMINDIRRLYVQSLGEIKYTYEADSEFDVMGLYQKLEGNAPYNQTPNQEGIAFSTTSHHLYGTEYDPARTVAMQLPADVSGAAFRNGNGEYIYVLWATTVMDNNEFSSTTYSFPSSLGVNQLFKREWNYVQSNAESVIGSQGIALTGIPIFLLENNEVLFPPISLFEADVLEGCPGYSINFTDLSQDADSWSWTFPGGTPATSTLQNPTVTYNTSGDYDVLLEVSNAAGSHTYTIPNYVYVDNGPEADFDIVINGNSVEFTNTSDNATNYLWSFGDGQTTLAFDPVHYFSNNGYYDVELIAYNDCSSDTIVQQVAIQVVPIANFNIVTPTGCGPYNVEFQDLSGAQPTDWIWSFPGATPATSTSSNPSVMYTNPGTYDVMMIVSNSVGADTLVQTLNLQADAVSSLSQTLCDGESLIVNGTVYDQTNAAGTETIAGGSFLGCDSIINIALNFYPVAIRNINRMLCEGDNFTVNGNIYDQNNPSGTEVIIGGSYLGCDSTINVSLAFSQNIVYNLNETLCPDESITVNGTTYDINNPTGSETFTVFLSCDSTVNINLDFYESSTNLINDVLCDGESVIINGTVYDQSNLAGTEVIANGNYQGCDSTILVSLSFYPSIIENITSTICEEENILVNGVTYDIDNAMGSEVIIGGNYQGCDSTINVALNFFAPATSLIDTILCPNENIFVNGTLYSKNNTSGVEVIPNASVNGCDSIVTINVTIPIGAELYIDSTLCTGSVIVNGTTYDEDNPSGIEVLQNASYNGCDSTIFIDLSYGQMMTSLVETICDGDTIFVGSSTYTMDGFYSDTLSTSTGCDSVIFLSLDVLPILNETSVVDLCEGDEYEDVIYTENDTLMMSFTTIDGCDSLVTIFIEVHPTSEGTMMIDLCEGDEYNDIVYTQNDTLMMSLSNEAGCDSILTVFIEVHPTSEETLIIDLCEGDQFGGINYFSDTLVVDTLLNLTNCDSIVWYDIMIEPISETFLVDTIEQGESYMVGTSSYIQTGMYTNVLTAFNLCDSIVHLDLTVVNTTSINEIENAYAFNCFPNPFSDKLTIEFTLAEQEQVTIQLFDVQGRLIQTLSQREVVNSGKHRYTIDGKELTAGVYYCKFQSDDYLQVIKVAHL